MTLHLTALRSAGLIAALAVALAGCVSGNDVGSASPAPATSVAPEPDDTAATSDEEPMAEAGVYVEYRDGIIAETAGTKVLFFHASWCPQCRSLEESILSGPIPDDLTIIKVDFDTATELRQQYGVTLQTTIVYVDDDGAQLSSEVLYSDTSLDALVAAAP